MTYYLAKGDELNLLICIQRGLWGQHMNRLKAWKPKDRLILYTDEGISGLFEVTSNQFEDDAQVWPDRTYSYRVTLNPLKVLSPENREPITEQNVKNDIVSLYGKEWGMKLVRNLRPLDTQIARKIEKIIEEQPPYDPFLTIDEDIKRLTAPGPKPKPGGKDDEKTLHESIIDMLAQIGTWEGKYSETEYTIGNLGRLDVVWKRIKTGHPSYVFEVQIKGNFYQALAKLKHAFDLWNSTPVLVTTEQFVTQAEELLSGSFHEMRRQAKIINYEKIQEMFSLEESLNELKEELDL